MSGYLQFERTGHKEVDDILWMIEQAGDAYHHTNQWHDSFKFSDGIVEPSYIDQINQKIREAKIALDKGKQDE